MRLVNTDRYPIGRLDTELGRAFVEQCRAVFAENGLVVLPDFVTTEAVRAIAEEAEGRVDAAFFARSEHNVLLDAGDDRYARDDARNRLLGTRVGSIAADELDTDGCLWRLYRSPALTAFIGAVLGYEEFHRGEDPLGAVSINVYRQGDLHEWHFDESQFSVTIMIQEPIHGGHFEYVTGLRSADSADLDGIAKVLDGDQSRVERLQFRAGSLSIFGGRNTLHRVTEVGGDRPRLVPILTYDTVAGSTNSETVRELFWGRTG